MDPEKIQKQVTWIKIHQLQPTDVTLKTLK